MMNLDLFREPKQRKTLLSAGLSWLFDAMDVGIISFIATALALEWALTDGEVGLLTSMTSVGMVIGAAFAGVMADRYGRKAVLLWTLLIFSIASGLSAFATNYELLCVLRFIAGVGLGGELPVASTLVSESINAKDRGRAVVLLESFWAGGWILAALISFFIIPEYGWRIAFFIGAAPAVYALYLRRAIEDPPRFNKQKNQARSIPFKDKFSALWSSSYRRSTLMLWILWFAVVFSYYGMFLWLPSIMHMKGFSLVKSFGYVLIMTLAQLPGYFTAAYFIEKFGRKFVLVTYLVMTAVSALWFGNASTEASLITAGIFLSFFNLGAWGGMYAYTPELYPTKVRSSGVGFAASFGRIGGVIAPILVGVLLEQGTTINSIFIMFFVVVLIGAGAVLLLGIETKGKELVD